MQKTKNKNHNIRRGTTGKAASAKRYITNTKNFVTCEETDDWGQIHTSELWIYTHNASSFTGTLLTKEFLLPVYHQHIYNLEVVLCITSIPFAINLVLRKIEPTCSHFLKSFQLPVIYAKDKLWHLCHTVSLQGSIRLRESSLLFAPCCKFLVVLDVCCSTPASISYLQPFLSKILS